MENAGGGTILNISSMAGENKNKRIASYASSKAAVNHLTRNIAFDPGACPSQPVESRTWIKTGPKRDQKATRSTIAEPAVLRLGLLLLVDPALLARVEITASLLAGTVILSWLIERFAPAITESA